MPRRKRTSEGDGTGAIDLTPMIDCVFQLIIFFMVVTQITTQENVNLRLPDAISANKEPQNAKKIFTVHIASADQSSKDAIPKNWGWFCFGEPRPKSPDEMRPILDKMAALVDAGKDYTGRNAQGISENMIYVRCDARCPAGEFAKLIELLVEVKMYKIKVAVMKDSAQ